MPPVVIIVQFPQQGHKSLSLTQQVYSNSLPHGITLSDGSKTQVIFDCAHMYEKLVNQNLNYVYTRAQSPTGMRLYLYELTQAISGIQIVERERKREPEKEKSEVRLLGIFCSCFFQTGSKNCISIWRSFFCFGFRSLYK